MSDDPFTPAELEAGAAAIAAKFINLSVIKRSIAGEVLAAVLPLHAARVRAEVAEEIAQAMEPLVDLSEEANDPAALRERRICTAIARAHRTTPGDDHAG